MKRIIASASHDKLGCVVRMIATMVVDTILPHAECGPNDHRKDAPPFKTRQKIFEIIKNWIFQQDVTMGWSKEKDISSVNQVMDCLSLSVMPWLFLVRKYQVKMPKK